MREITVRALKALSHVFIRLLRFFEQPLAPSRADQSEARQSESSMRHAAIVLTTFSDRFFSHAIPTLQSFKDANLERRVFVVVNGDQDKNFDEEIRNQFLTEALAIYPVSPICFGSARGMAELWNAGARYADQESLIFMNEDLLIDPNGLLEAIELIEAALETTDLVILNESFGHFGLKRKCFWTWVGLTRDSLASAKKTVISCGDSRLILIMENHAFFVPITPPSKTLHRISGT